jgi:hypothetical protein
LFSIHVWKGEEWNEPDDSSFDRILFAIKLVAASVHSFGSQNQAAKTYINTNIYSNTNPNAYTYSNTHTNTFTRTSIKPSLDGAIRRRAGWAWLQPGK